MAPPRKRAKTSQVAGTSNGSTNGYQVLEEPLNSSTSVKVVCIGTGVSGLVTAIRAQEMLTNCEFDIYEKNSDLGGTWLENR